MYIVGSVKWYLDVEAVLGSQRQVENFLVTLAVFGTNTLLFSILNMKLLSSTQSTRPVHGQIVQMREIA